MSCRNHSSGNHGPHRSLRTAGWTACAPALVLLVLAGCGLKGDPMPPLRNVPLATKDLQLRQEGGFILLEMSYPNVTVSGMNLGGIDAVELLQMVRPTQPDGALPQVDPREFAAGASELLVLRGAELNAAVTGDRIQVRLPLAEELPDEPAANVFGVRTRKGDESSELSNLAALVPIPPPPPPSALEITPLAGSIELSWQIDEAAAADIEGFEVFRREAQNRGYGPALGRVAGSERRFEDDSARYGRRYIYTVRTIASSEPLILSAEAGEREVEYVDRFAPPLPRNFVALAERASVRLRWDPSAAGDVAGYILYRREPGRDFHPITDDPVTALEFLDRGLTSGFSYSYRIQVLDREGNESQLSEAVTTTVR